MPRQRHRGALLALLDIPQADEVVARRGSEEIGGGRVEDYLTDFPSRQLVYGKTKEAHRPPALSLPTGVRSSGAQ